MYAAVTSSRIESRSMGSSMQHENNTVQVHSSKLKLALEARKLALKARKLALEARKLALEARKLALDAGAQQCASAPPSQDAGPAAPTHGMRCSPKLRSQTSESPRLPTCASQHVPSFCPHGCTPRSTCPSHRPCRAVATSSSSVWRRPLSPAELHAQPRPERGTPYPRASPSNKLNVAAVTAYLRCASAAERVPSTYSIAAHLPRILVVSCPSGRMSPVHRVRRHLPALATGVIAALRGIHGVSHLN